MENIFENAKFGDKFKTRDGRMAVFFAFGRYNKNAAYFIIDPQQNSVENTHMTLLLSYDGHYKTKLGEDIVSRWEEPIDEEKLDKLIDEEIVQRYKYSPALLSEVAVAFKKGYRKAKEE